MFTLKIFALTVTVLLCASFCGSLYFYLSLHAALNASRAKVFVIFYFVCRAVISSFVFFVFMQNYARVILKTRIRARLN